MSQALYDEIFNRISSVDLDNTSPQEALEILRELQRKINPPKPKYFIWRIDIGPDGVGHRTLLADRGAIGVALGFIYREAKQGPNVQYSVEEAGQLRMAVTQSVESDRAFTDEELRWLQYVADRAIGEDLLRLEEVSSYGLELILPLIETGFITIVDGQIALSETGKARLNPRTLTFPIGDRNGK